jgi:hypothetical protein
MTHRKESREPIIITTVIEQKSGTWGDETRKVARTDAQRVLEALVAEYGIENTIRALDRQGFKGSAYRYLLKPLHTEAVRRRSVHEHFQARDES